MPEEIQTQSPVDITRSIIEKILETPGKNPVSYLARNQGKFSVYPDKVHVTVTHEKLFQQCGTLCAELGRELEKSGLPVDTCVADITEPYDHLYLTTVVGGQEIIIDPTIGQFLLGHNHIFVGTRPELHGLFTENSKYPIIGTFMEYAPEEVFQMLWGEKGKELHGREPLRSYLTQEFMNRTR